jgi:hypothetical protein
MKANLLIFAGFLLVGLVSCKPTSTFIAKQAGEFIEPKNETVESIIEYCRDKKVNYDKSYVIKSKDLSRSFIGKYQHIPGIFLFDKDKSLLTTVVKTDCPWTMMNLLKDTITETKLVKDSLIYHDIMLHFKLIDDRSKNNKVDYYILSTWAKFVP